MIKLYHCKNSRSVRPLWALEELGLSYELVVMPFPPRSEYEGYLDVNEVEVAETNLGQFILNDGDLHIVFPDVLFANLDTNHSEQIKTSILEKTLCDRLNGKQFLMTKKLSYPDHSFYFLLAPTSELCNQAMNIYSIDKYRIYSNIEDNRYKVKKIEKISD